MFQQLLFISCAEDSGELVFWGLVASPGERNSTSRHFSLFSGELKRSNFLNTMCLLELVTFYFTLSRSLLLFSHCKKASSYIPCGMLIIGLD